MRSRIGSRSIKFSGTELPEKRRLKGEKDEKGFRFLRYSVIKKRNCFYEVWLPESVFLQKRSGVRAQQKMQGVLKRVAGNRIPENRRKHGEINELGLRFQRYSKSKGILYEVWYPEESFRQIYQKALERNKKRYWVDPAASRARLKSQRRSNPQKFKQYSKNNYNKHREKILAKSRQQNRKRTWSDWLCYKANLRKKGEININPKLLEKLKEEQKSKCYWTGIEMNTLGCGNKMDPYEISIDRVDNNVGYVIHNCVLATRGANFGRGACKIDLWKVFLRELGVKKWGQIAGVRPEKEIYKYWDSWLMSSVNGSSRIRGHPLPSFKKEKLIEIYDRQEGLCIWSKLRMDLTGPYDPYNPFKISVERLDNLKPYTEDNIALVCHAINKARNMAPLEKFLGYLEDIRRT